MTASLPDRALPATPASRRPGLLTFFAIVAIAAGAMKGFGAASAVAAPRLLSAQQSFMKNMGAGASDTPVARAQAESQLQVQQAMVNHRTLTVLSASGAGLLAVGLLIGGIGCLSLRRRARPVLIAAFGWGLALNLAVAWPTLQMQMELAEINTRMITRIMQESALPGGAAAPAWIRTASSAVGAIGIAMSISMMAAYALFFVAGMIYLTRPKVARLFQANP